MILNFLYARVFKTTSHLGNTNTNEGIINFEISKHLSWYRTKHHKACSTWKSLSISQNLPHVQIWSNGLGWGFILTHMSILCLFSALPFCCSRLANSGSWGLGLQHKGFPNELLKLLKICVNICWDLLQATYSKGRQKGAHIEGNETDG